MPVVCIALIWRVSPLLRRESDERPCEVDAAEAVPIGYVELETMLPTM